MQFRFAEQARRLSHTDWTEIERRISEGETYDVAASAVGCSEKAIQRFMARTGGVIRRAKERSLLRLSQAEREEVSRGLVADLSFAEIARRMGRATSTVSRELR